MLKIPTGKNLTLEKTNTILTEDIPAQLEGASCGWVNTDERVGTELGTGRIAKVLGMPGREGRPLGLVESGMAARSDGFIYPQNAQGLVTTCPLMKPDDNGSPKVRIKLWRDPGDENRNPGCTPLEELPQGDAGALVEHECKLPELEDPACRSEVNAESRANGEEPDEDQDQTPPRCAETCDWINGFTVFDCTAFEDINPEPENPSQEEPDRLQEKPVETEQPVEFPIQRDQLPTLTIPPQEDTPMFREGAFVPPVRTSFFASLLAQLTGNETTEERAENVVRPFDAGQEDRLRETLRPSRCVEWRERYLCTGHFVRPAEDEGSAGSQDASEEGAEPVREYPNCRACTGNECRCPGPGCTEPTEPPVINSQNFFTDEEQDWQYESFFREYFGSTKRQSLPETPDDQLAEVGDPDLCAGTSEEEREQRENSCVVAACYGFYQEEYDWLNRKAESTDQRCVLRLPGSVDFDSLPETQSMSSAYQPETLADEERRNRERSFDERNNPWEPVLDTLAFLDPDHATSLSQAVMTPESSTLRAMEAVTETPPPEPENPLVTAERDIVRTPQDRETLESLRQIVLQRVELELGNPPDPGNPQAPLQIASVDPAERTERFLALIDRQNRDPDVLQNLLTPADLRVLARWRAYMESWRVFEAQQRALGRFPSAFDPFPEFDPGEAYTDSRLTQAVLIANQIERLENDPNRVVAPPPPTFVAVQSLPTGNYQRATDDTVHPRTDDARFVIRWLQDLFTDIQAVLKPPVIRVRVPALWDRFLPDDVQVAHLPGLASAKNRTLPIDLQVRAGPGLLDAIADLLAQMTHLREEEIALVVPLVSRTEIENSIAQWERYKRDRETLKLDVQPEVDVLIERLREYAKHDYADQARGLRAQLPLYLTMIVEKQGEAIERINDWVKENAQRYKEILAANEERLSLAGLARDIGAEAVRFGEVVNMPWCRSDRFTVPPYSFNGYIPGWPEINPGSCDGTGDALPLVCPPGDQKTMVYDLSILKVDPAALSVPTFTIASQVLRLPVAPTSPETEIADPASLALPEPWDVGTIDWNKALTPAFAALGGGPPIPALPTFDAGSVRPSMERALSILRERNRTYGDYLESVRPGEKLDALACPGWATTPCKHTEQDLLERVTKLVARPGAMLKEDLMATGSRRFTTPGDDVRGRALSCDPADHSCSPLWPEYTAPPDGWQILRGDADQNQSPFDAIRRKLREETFGGDGQYVTDENDVPLPYRADPADTYPVFERDPDTRLNP